MSLAGSNRKPALTAAARRIAFSRQTADKLKEESWQERAWAVYDKLPAVFYMTRYRSDVASKIDYFVATQDEPGADPNSDEDGAGSKVLEAEGGPELLRRIVSEFIVHWDVPGEAYLTRFDEAPFWRVLSTQELKKHGNRFTWGDETNNLGSIEQDQVFRVWDPHPRFHWQADSPVRHILEEAEELILLSRTAKVQSMSQVAAGVFVLPDSIDLSPFADDEDGTPDDVARWLIEVLARPISDPGSSSAVVPAVMTMNGDDIAKIRHITFARDWEVNLELRKELLASVAIGLDLPPEILTGVAGLNHWSAWLVSEQAVSQHVLPSVDAILDSLTQNWFRPLLEASGLDPDLYVLWRDPSPATVPPDQSDVAIKLNELGVISDEATRRVTNFDEEDKATPEELAEKTARRDAGQGIPTDGPPVQSAIDPDDALRFFELLDRNPRLADLLQQAFVEEGDPPLARAAVTAATRRRIVATELAEIDAEILVWVQAQADLEIERLTKLALSAAVDPLDESLLTGLASKLEAKIAEAQAAARSWLSRTLGREPSNDGESLARSQGVQVIIGGILEAVRRKLFTPGGAPDPIELGQIGNITTPTQAIRHGLSLAGGGPAVYEDGKSAELIGNGQHVHDELAEDGFFQDGYEWKYGHPANTFEPHLHLDGKQFTSWDDPQLAVNFGDSWLRRSHYAPGDHKGCCCAFIQVIVQSAASGTSVGLGRPDEPTPAGAALTWEQFGIKLPTDPARRRVLNEALQRLNGLPPGVRERFIDLLGRFNGGVKFNVATASTKAITELGKVSEALRVVGNTALRKRSLSLQMMRQAPEYDQWVQARNSWINGHERTFEGMKAMRSEGRPPAGWPTNMAYTKFDELTPPPPQWRLATPDELADVLVHELGHANDFQLQIDAGVVEVSSVIPKDISNLVRDMYHNSGDRIAAYEYANSKPVEAIAELQRFFLRGIQTPEISLTAYQWRLANPQLATWIQENYLT